MKPRLTPRLLLAFLAVALCLAPAVAQSGGGAANPGAPQPGMMAKGKADLPLAQEARAIVKALAITPEELKKIEAILTKDESTLAKKRADLQVFQAQIARLMLEANPSLDQIGGLVKQGQGLEYDTRMIQFARQVEIKRLLGDQRWAILYRFAHSVGVAARDGRLKEIFNERRLDKGELEIWKILLAYARRIL